MTKTLIMKKLLIMAIASVMSLSVSAQLISSNTVTYSTEKGSNYNRLGVSYNSLKGEGDGDAVDGVSLSWTKGISVSKSMPLFIETGLGATYGFDGISGVIATIPLNVTYKIPVVESIKIAPLVGITFNGNIFANDIEQDLNIFTVGWQIGANIELDKLYVGVSYGAGFMNYTKDEEIYLCKKGGYVEVPGTKLKNLAATIGFVF